MEGNRGDFFSGFGFNESGFESWKAVDWRGGSRKLGEERRDKWDGGRGDYLYGQELIANVGFRTDESSVRSRELFLEEGGFEVSFSGVTCVAAADMLERGR